MDVRDRTDVGDGRERWRVIPESLDDLWHLHHVIEPGDLVGGETTRRIQRAEENLRDTGGEREHLSLTIAVEDVEFHKFSNRLRIGGLIESCSREDQVGLHHTLNLEPNQEITIEKRFKSDQRDRLEEATEAGETPTVAIVTVEEGTAHVHRVAQYGTEEVARLTGTTGKGDDAASRSDLFEELCSVLKRTSADAIILAGPGFTKQDALTYLEEHAPEVTERIHVVDTASVGDRGVHEVLKRGALEDVQAETRIAEEAELIDDLTEQIATEGKAAYGPANVAEAAEYGAVERLLVLDELLRGVRAEEAETDIDIETIMNRVEQQGGDVVVFSSEFDPGRQLDHLGGIAALLRYPLD